MSEDWAGHDPGEYLSRVVTWLREHHGLADWFSTDQGARIRVVGIELDHDQDGPERSAVVIRFEAPESHPGRAFACRLLAKNLHEYPMSQQEQLRRGYGPPELWATIVWTTFEERLAFADLDAAPADGHTAWI